MQTDHNKCLDTGYLHKYLNEQLDEGAEFTAARHIDMCPGCQRSLEQVAAGDNDWDDAREQLIDHLPVAPDETIALNDRDRDRELEQLKTYLGPTDDPQNMGRLGSYEIRGLVGRGSTGIVVKALQPQLNRYVAIKILSPMYASNGAARSRFEREARSAAAVIHENVVPIYAVDEFRNLPYLVMQYVSGGSLLQRIEKQGPLETCEVARIGMQIARGLAAAHEQGIIHRDVKPANVMLEDRVERAMVSDFGLARVADEAAMTRSGVIAGTPQFMSPEQARGESLDSRSDLFSLGSVLYTACTGRPPFRSESVFGVIKKVCDAEPRMVREINPKIDPWLESFVEKLLKKDREDRFESAQQVSEILSGELAYAQNPMIATPVRDWIVAKPVTPVASGNRGIQATFAIVAAMMVIGLGLWASGLLTSETPDTAWGKKSGLTNNANNGGAAGSDSQGSLNTPVTSNGQEAPNTIQVVEKKTFLTSPGSKMTLKTDFEAISVIPADIDKIKFSIVRDIEADSKSDAEEIAMNHLFIIERDDEDDWAFKLKMKDEFLASVGSNPVRNASLQVKVPREFNVDLLTSSGEIRIGDLDGDVAAETYAGKIDIGKVSGSIVAKSNSGSIFTRVGPGGVEARTNEGSIYPVLWAREFDDCYFSSAHGHIGIGMEENSSVTVDAKSASGKITAPVSGLQVTGRLRHDFGDGGSLITARSDNGTIDFKTLKGVVLSDDIVAGTSNVNSTKVVEASAPIENRGVAGQLISVEGEYTNGIIDGYQIYLPRSYDEVETGFPIIVSLAGGCFVGGKIEDLSCWGMPEEIDTLLGKETIDEEDERTRLLLDTFIVISPHMIDGDFDERQFYDHPEAIAEILDEVANSYRTLSSQVYLTGGGRGGHGAWGLASQMPERFAAVVPIRGLREGIKDYNALVDLPVWVAHCLDDEAVNYGESAAVVRRLEKAGSQFHIIELCEPDDDTYLEHRNLFTSYPGKDWPNLYAGTAMYKWLLTHEKSGGQE